MRCLLICLMVLVSAGSARAELPTTLEPFAWLEGEWTRETSRGVFVERWARVSEATMEGSVEFMRSGEAVLIESMRIEKFVDGIYLTARPAENPYPTSFRLIECAEGHFAVENPAHDFPQRIFYTLGDEGRLDARIEGTVDGEERAVDFVFERRAP